MKNKKLFKNIYFKGVMLIAFIATILMLTKVSVSKTNMIIVVVTYIIFLFISLRLFRRIKNGKEEGDI